jgi:hypothetical protein
MIKVKFIKSNFLYLQSALQIILFGISYNFENLMLLHYLKSLHKDHQIYH